MLSLVNVIGKLLGLFIWMKNDVEASISFLEFQKNRLAIWPFAVPMVRSVTGLEIRIDYLTIGK